MNAPRGWHPAAAVLQSYAIGTAGAASGASVEAHLLACRACREALAPAVDAARLSGLMDGIDDRLDAASRPTAERWLGALGLDEADARVLLATPVLRRSWWLAVILALLLAVLAAQEAPDGSTALLVLAPLLPMAATAAAFAPRLDPAWQLTAATPFPQLRLLLLRTGAVAGGSTILAVAAGLFLPVGPGAAIRWLVPAAALAAAVLALATWLEPGTAAGICGVVWLTLVAVVSHGGSTALELYDLPAQAASVAVLAAACSVIYRQRHHLRSGSPA